MLTYTLIDPNNSNNIVIVEFTENIDGTVTILMKQDGTLLGDFRGLFFDWPNNDGLTGDLQVDSISGDGLKSATPLLFELVQSDENVKSAGSPSNNVNGLPSTPYDVGIELGSQGKGKDDIQEVTLVLSTISGDPLTLEDFSDATLGVHLTSVQDGNKRNESLKLEQGPEDDCLMGHVDFTDKDVNKGNFLNNLPDGVMVTAENIDDNDEIFTVEEVGFIDKGGPLNKGVGASSETTSPGSNVDTQTGFKPTGEDADGNVIGEAEEIKISFKEDEFPDGVLNIKLWITRLFPNEGTGNDNESLRWTTYKDGAQVATDTYEASNSDPELFGASHAVELMIDTGEEFDEIVLTALRYNNDAADNGGTEKDSSDFLRAGFWYKYKVPPENQDPEIRMEIFCVQESMSITDDDDMPGFFVEDFDLDVLVTDPDDGDVHTFMINGVNLSDIGPEGIESADGHAVILVSNLAENEINVKLTAEGEDFHNNLPEGEMSEQIEGWDIKVTDSAGATDDTTLKYQVKGNNDAPEIKIDCLTKEVTEVMEPKAPGEMEGTAHPTGNLITDSNAMDPDGDDLYVKIDGQVITDETTLNGTWGMLVIQANGDYEYVLDQAAVNSLKEGEMENDSFTFSVVDREDGGKMSNDAELKIKINGANDAPEIMVDCLTKEVTEVMEPKAPGEMEGTAHPTGNLITDSNAMDPDGDDLYVKIDGQVITDETTLNGTWGMLVIQANGDYEYVLDQAAVNSLKEGEMENDSFTFSVVDREDGGKMSNDAELKIKINGANDAPVIKGVCLEGRVDFTTQEVNSDNFLDTLPAGVMISAENIDDLDNIFTPQEVGFIDNGAPLHKGIGASSQTVMPGSHVDTQTGFKPTGEDLQGNVIGEAEQLKISFKGPEFPDGIVKIELDITRLFPNEGANNNNETLRWTILKDDVEVGTGDYEASTTDDPLFGADHAVRITIDPDVEFDEVILTALRYNGDAPDNGGDDDDSSDFLLAGFSYEYKTLCLNKEITEVMEPKVPGDMEGTAHPTGNLIIDSNAMDPDDGDDIYVKIGGQVVTQETIINGTYGDLVIQANGSYEYVLTQAAVNYLQEGEMVFDNFIFSVVDREEGGKMSNEAKLVVKINGANDAPTAEANMYMATEDAIDINGNIILDDTGAGVDSDPENDPLVVVGIKDLDIQSPIQVTPNLIQDDLSTGGDLILELATNDGAALFTLKADGSWTLVNSGGDPPCSKMKCDTLEYLLENNTSKGDANEKVQAIYV